MLDERKIRDYFYNITEFEPYNFQVDMCRKVLNGEDVVMQAPTGCGKTWASVVPFIIAKKENIPFPAKLIYSLPLRVLANSLYKDVKEKLIKYDPSIKVTIQTGETPEDPYFEGDIIFTTVDQSLSSALLIPFALPNRQCNINAGAFVSSYHVFDEFHLLDWERSLSTTINLLRMFKNTARFCLMTATLSNEMVDRICTFLNAGRVSVSPDEYAKLQCNVNKYRIVHTYNRELKADDVISKHKKRTIVLCNTVERAQSLFLELKEKIKGNERFSNTSLICLHSRFYQKDRMQKEDDIKRLFSKESDSDAILISTQVVEVGIDITCDTMHTEISEISSFLQRIGRAARYGGEEADIYVYDIDKEKGTYLPYNKDISQKTLNELNEVQGKNMDFYLGQEIINKVLTQRELEIYETIRSGDRDLRIKDCWIKPERKWATDLIRKIENFNVVISSNPYEIRNPYFVDSVSINKHSLISKLKKIDKEDEEDWIIKKIEEDSFGLDDENDFSYTTVGVDEDILFSYDRIIVNPKYVFYDEDIGLNFEKTGETQLVELEKVCDDKVYSMRLESYREHVQKMIQVYQKLLRPQVINTLNSIWERNKVDVSIDEIINFMIILHDYGKLNLAWQKKAHEWQAKKAPAPKDMILAHTDWDEGDEKTRLPNHAGIGALVCYAIAPETICDEIVIAMVSSIARHHSPMNDSCESYFVPESSVEEIFELIKTYCPSLYNDIDKRNKYLFKNTYNQSLESYMVTFSDVNESMDTILYFIFSRILRLCDQKACEQ